MPDLLGGGVRLNQMGMARPETEIVRLDSGIFSIVIILYSCFGHQIHFFFPVVALPHRQHCLLGTRGMVFGVLATVSPAGLSGRAMGCGPFVSGNASGGDGGAAECQFGLCLGQITSRLSERNGSRILLQHLTTIICCP